jgi:AcrR family transcriptional regulator
MMAQALPAGRGSLPAEATRFLQRARLLDATAETVAELGYAGASIDAIRSRAGVSARTFYEHFASKEEAVGWAFDAAASYALPRVLGAIRGQREWAAGLDAALTTYLAIVDCDRAWARLCLVELPGSVRTRRRQRLEPLIAELPAGAPVPARDAIAAVDGVLRERLIDGVPRLQALREELLALLLSPTLGPAGVRRLLERPPTRPAEVDPLGRARRIAELIEQLPTGAPSLEVELQAADAERDGPALWRAVLAFHDLRSRGRPFDWRLERLALDGLEAASFFGLPVRAMGNGAASEWLVPSPAQRCLRFVAEHPGCSGQDVRQALGIAHLSQVSRLLAALRREGLVVSRRRGGRANAWEITAAGRAALQSQK